MHAFFCASSLFDSFFRSSDHFLDHFSVNQIPCTQTCSRNHPCTPANRLSSARVGSRRLCHNTRQRCGRLPMVGSCSTRRTGHPFGLDSRWVCKRDSPFSCMPSCARPAGRTAACFLTRTAGEFGWPKVIKRRLSISSIFGLKKDHFQPDLPISGSIGITDSEA